jgi:hypothetical protein
LLAGPGIDTVLGLRTKHLGPDELLVTGRIGVGPDDDADQISRTINAATDRLRRAVPSAKIVYLESDVTRQPHATRSSARAPQASTETGPTVAGPSRPRARPW